MLDRSCRGELETFTPLTTTDTSALLEMLKTVRAEGLAEIDQGFEDGVYGIAAPIFASNGSVTGSVGVATPITRINDAFRDRARGIVIKAANDITRAWGGIEPQSDMEGTAA